MIKAADIKKINPKEFKFLTKDLDGVYAWNYAPKRDISGWYAGESEKCRGYLMGDIEVEEFSGKDWQDCLIEFEADYSEMIGCVGWFWDDDDDAMSLGILSESTKGGFYTNLGSWLYKHFRPAKPNELKFYEEEDDN